MKDYRGREYTRYHFDLFEDNKEYADVKQVLDYVDGTQALIKDAVIKYVRSAEFNLERYEGPQKTVARKGIK